jgi:hypothetical protein
MIMVWYDSFEVKSLNTDPYLHQCKVSNCLTDSNKEIWKLISLILRKSMILYDGKLIVWDILRYINIYEAFFRYSTEE